MISESVSQEAVYIDGELCQQFPDDLYIPPDAMRVLLDSFSGPLDLLLYLIRKQNIDILDIPIVPITQQYLQYIAMLQTNRFELAADYLLMAATLAEIKSRLLLPCVQTDDEQEIDPRMALVRQLQQYECIKQAAQALFDLPCQEKDTHALTLKTQGISKQVLFPQISLHAVVNAMQAVLLRSSHRVSHQVQNESFTIRGRIDSILKLLKHSGRVSFYQMYLPHEGSAGLVVSLLAVLELAKLNQIVIEQDSPYADITIEVNHDRA